MKATFMKKVMTIMFIAVIMVSLLQGFSFAKSENVELLKKSEEEYIIYVKNLLSEKFYFAFSNDENEPKATLEFIESAIDQPENGNHIAYVDLNDVKFSKHFGAGKDTFLWVKKQVDDTYVLEAEKIDLSDSISETEIQEMNSVTKRMNTSFGQKELPAETIDGVTVTRKIGKVTIEDENKEFATYKHKIVRATSGSDAEQLISLVTNQMNNLEGKNIFEQLSTYTRFRELYNKLQPAIDDENWKEIEDYTILQPEDSEDGEQYLVWIKKSPNAVRARAAIEIGEVDLKIMTSTDQYTEKTEMQEKIIKETVKLPITGENLTLFVIAGVVIVLIVLFAVLKIKNNKKDKTA